MKAVCGTRRAKNEQETVACNSRCTDGELGQFAHQIIRAVAEFGQAGYDTSCLLSEQGQASIEAAALLPSLLLVLGLLLQPACALYTKSCMYSAASEGLRLSATVPAGERDSLVRANVLRRLKAVPSLSIFHSGGEEGWELEQTSDASLKLRGRLRLLPFVGLSAWMFGERSGNELVLEVEVNAKLRPSWVSGEYESWISVWD